MKYQKNKDLLLIASTSIKKIPDHSNANNTNQYNRIL